MSDARQDKDRCEPPGEFLDLDVRPILRDGRDPFHEIMTAVAALARGQGLRLRAPFMPEPLLGVLAQRGFAHEVRELPAGDWEVRFRPAGSAA